jgi:hypothetical protein
MDVNYYETLISVADDCPVKDSSDYDLSPVYPSFFPSK